MDPQNKNPIDNQYPALKTNIDNVEDDDTSTAHYNSILDNGNRRSNWFNYLWGDIYATDDPNQFSSKKKSIIIFIVAMGGLCGPLSSMMYMPGILAVAKDLNTSISAVNGTISAYVVFMGISVSFVLCLFLLFLLTPRFLHT